MIYHSFGLIFGGAHVPCAIFFDKPRSYTHGHPQLLLVCTHFVGLLDRTPQTKRTSNAIRCRKSKLQLWQLQSAALRKYQFTELPELLNAIGRECSSPVKWAIPTLCSPMLVTGRCFHNVSSFLPFGSSQCSGYQYYQYSAVGVKLSQKLKLKSHRLKPTTKYNKHQIKCMMLFIVTCHPPWRLANTHWFTLGSTTWSIIQVLPRIQNPGFCGWILALF